MAWSVLRRVPTVETLRVIADDMGLELSRDRLHQAAESHAVFRPKLEAFRRLKFPYLEAVEPAHVRAWIENGGTSSWSPRARPLGSDTA